MNFNALQLIIGFICIIICIGIYIYRKLTFWKRQGLVQSIGHIKKCFDIPIHYADMELVKKYGNVIGTYELLSPTLIITDPQLIHKVLIENFRTFADHRVWVLEHQVIGKSVLLLSYTKWKISRSIISPTFSPKNLKNMIPVIDESIDSFINNINKCADNGDDLDINPFVLSFLMDVTLKAFFGTKLDFGDDTNNIVVSHMKSLLHIDFSLPQIISFLSPSFASIFGWSILNKENTKFLSQLIQMIIDQRKQNNHMKHNDFIQYLMDAESEEKDHYNQNKKLSMKEVIDNCILFFTAAFDTSSSVINHFIQLLAMNTNIQDNIIAEINDITNGTIDFETLNKMHYLDACICETMRLYSPVSRIEKKVTRDTTIGNVFIPKGNYVIIPLYTVHRDPNNFKDPLEFKPERFMPENKHLIKRGTYLPFGDGPKICLGMRFAMMQIKLFIINLLKKYEIIETPKTKELHYIKGLPSLSLKNMYIKINRRNNLIK